jgi:enoyl-CoA hydratase/carnithine racemase
VTGASSQDVLQVATHGDALVVTLNRPQRANAFDSELLAALTALWGRDDLLRQHRCVVITGAGRAFCAGADVGFLHDEREQINESVVDELAFLPGARIDIPVIAAVNGVCAGGGLHFVADSDIAICSDQASFLDPHVSVGHVTALEPMSFVLRARLDVLARMALLGRHERLDAERACRAGIVSEVVPHDDLMRRALELAGQIASNSPAAVAASRRAMHRLRETVVGPLLQEGWDMIRGHWSHPDAMEGPAAFVDQREPQWERR